MDLHHSSPPRVTAPAVGAATWPLDDAGDIPTFPRTRRYRRSLLGYRSEVLMSGLLLVLLIWMAFVALTLWH